MTLYGDDDDDDDVGGNGDGGDGGDDDGGCGAGSRDCGRGGGTPERAQSLFISSQFDQSVIPTHQLRHRGLGGGGSGTSPVQTCSSVEVTEKQQLCAQRPTQVHDNVLSAAPLEIEL